MTKPATTHTARPPAVALERAHDIFFQTRSQPLDAIFVPKSVAVIGATESPGKVGRAVMANLSGFKGQVYPIHPERARVLGRPAFRRIADAPKPVDLAVIVTPAPTVPGLVRECVQAGIGGVVVISAGFKETGGRGVGLEREILEAIRGSRVRVVGPNCLGVMTPHAGFNATFAAAQAKPGNVALLSQSGALCTAILDWSFKEQVGFSAFVSVGSMLDVGWGDLITYFGDDPRTQSILCYMESVGDARAFLSAAREVALTKPILVLKVGRTLASAKAAASHTGSLTGSDDVLEAAFRRAGVLRVNTIAELFDMAEALSKQPRPRGPRLAIVTNAGGPGALAADMLAGGGGQLAPLSASTMEALNALLPSHWSHGNPIDILGDAPADRYAKAIGLAARDDCVDAVLAILTPQAMTDATATAHQLPPPEGLAGKPLLASWMGGPAVEEGESILNRKGIPTFKYPDRAARAFDLMWRYSDNLRSLYETPALPSAAATTAAAAAAPAKTKTAKAKSLQPAAARAKVQRLLAAAYRRGRTILTEFESKLILAAYAIPTVPTRVARSAQEAAQLAAKLGFPVAVKLFSETLTHKTDVGGVHLDVANARAVRQAWKDIRSSVDAKAGPGHFQGVTVQPMIDAEGYELILGSSVDPQFGPVLVFGAGGQLVEVMQDRALGLPPLTNVLARRMMEQTRIYRALQGVRGRRPVDCAALENLLVRFSQLIAEHPQIKELDVNPLLAGPDGMTALDARVVLHDPKSRESDWPKLAIRPYPGQYVTRWKLKDGGTVTVRPIRPEDEPLMIAFHRTLSERSVYHRYFIPLPYERRIAHERLSRICHVDYDREIALAVERPQRGGRASELVGVGRLSKIHGSNDAEFALLIADQWQGRGLGTRLLNLLVQIGRDEGLSRIVATILPDNHEMQRVCRKTGFDLRREPGQTEYHASLDFSRLPNTARAVRSVRSAD